MQQLTKKYGLATAIAMVVGIVIGSGIFFKAEEILAYTAGSIPLGILAWVIGAVIMLTNMLAFAMMATRFAKMNGLVDYAEATCGRTYAYLVSHFASVIYYPSITAVLAWATARYTVALFGASPASAACIAVGAFYLILSYAVNALSPRIAGKIQVSVTVIKLIPLAMIAVVGLLYGLLSGQLADSLSHGALASGAEISFFPAIICAVFAYDGWIIATTINAELREPKKTLPRALLFGGILIAAVYVLYYLGLAGAASGEELLLDATLPYTRLFGQVGGLLIRILIIVSCFGTLNGVMLASVRGFYALAVRGEGFRPKTLASVDPETNVPVNSAILSLLLCGAWFLYFYGTNLADTPWFFVFSFDSSALPIVSLYALYIPIFVMFMIKTTHASCLTRFVIPLLAVLASAFMVVCAVLAHRMSVVYYLILFAVIMAIGAIPLFRKQKKQSLTEE